MRQVKTWKDNTKAMHAGTITWNGVDLSGIGKPKLTISQQADPPSPAQPTRHLISLKVTVDLESLDPGTIQARVEYLQQSLKVADGILRSSSGTGHALEWLAVPAGNNLSAALTGTTNALEMSFSAVENHGSLAASAWVGSTFTPAGSPSPIHLHAVREFKEDIATERHASRASARRITTHTVSFTARVAQANPADPVATRLAYLQNQAENVKALDCREGTLVFGSINKIVRVQELSPQIDEGRGVLDVRVQCFYQILPSAEKAEAGFEIKDRVDAGSGERVLTYTGSIEAETREIALAKLDELRQNLSTAGRRTTFFETTDRAIDGADTEGVAAGSWTGGLNFTLEMRQARAGQHYTLKMTSTRDFRNGMRWTYSGTVTGTDEGSALTIARGLATAANHPLRTKSEESIEHLTNIYLPETGPQAGRDFVKLDFTYEFEGPSDGFIGGEISTDRNLPLFGEYRRVVSGHLIAITREAAETKMNQLLATEGTAIERSMKWSEVYLHEDGVEKRVFQKLEFSAGSRETRGNASCRYTDATSRDSATLLQQREVSGTIWTDTKAHADSALEEIIAALFGAGINRPTRIATTDHRERWGNPTQTSSTSSNNAWFQQDFQLGKTSKMTGEIGHDIIEATCTMERIGSINASVITAIPYGRPVAQVNTGYLPGKISIQATCKAVNSATARAWVQGKRVLVDGIGTAGITRHETEQPKESENTEHAPFSGTDVTTRTFTGSYGWTFTGTALDGLWGG